MSDKLQNPAEDELLPDTPVQFIWSISPRQVRKLKIGLASSAVGSFFLWFLSQFLQARGIVNLPLSRVFLSFAALSLWIFICLLIASRKSRVVAFILVAVVAVFVDWIAPKPTLTIPTNLGGKAAEPSFRVFDAQWLPFIVGGPIQVNLDFENLRPYALHVKMYGYAIPQPTPSPEVSRENITKFEDRLWRMMCEQAGTADAPLLTVPALQKMFATVIGYNLTAKDVRNLQENYETSIYYMAAFRYTDPEGADHQDEFCGIRIGKNKSILLCDRHNEPSQHLTCPIAPIKYEVNQSGTKRWTFESGDVLTIAPTTK